MANTILEWGLPPIEKIHEAFSAVADNRVQIDLNYAKVFSSDLKKEYTVSWENDIYSSNDNASYWQGYLGYPVIAVLMLQEKLRYDPQVAEHFKQINWKILNTQYKNDYSAVVNIILDELKKKGIDVVAINNEVSSIYEQIKHLDIKRKKGSLRPPSSK